MLHLIRRGRSPSYVSIELYVSVDFRSKKIMKMMKMMKIMKMMKMMKMMKIINLSYTRKLTLIDANRLVSIER